MRQLCIKLPPLAPDYSGVCSALYEMEGMSVIHDASGCTGNYTGFDEPRWYNDQRLVFCSGLREMDAVLGDDDKLIRKVIAAAKDLKPQFITVLGSPVPMVIGSDLEGIAKEIENLTGMPALGFNTTGLHYYDEGIAMAYLKVAQTFVTDKGEKTPHSVNLLGVTPLDFSIHNNLEDLKRFFEKNGYNVNTCWSMGCDLEGIKNTTKASCNVVVSASGLKLAKYLEKHFEMPYIIGLPVGKTGEQDILSQLREEESKKCRAEQESATTLIIGEQVLSNSIRRVLQEEDEMLGVDVASFFMLHKEIAQKNDIHIDNEIQLIKILKQNKYTRIIGDPLLKALLPEDNELAFIELPHVAVSSRLHWHQPNNVMGDNIYKIVNMEEKKNESI